MKKLPKISVLIFLFSLTGFLKVHGQNSLIIDRLIPREGTTYDFDSGDYYTLVDTAKKEPITGWVKVHFKKTLHFRHYLNGKLDGYSVMYVKRKKNYRLQEISKYSKGEIQTQAFYSHKKQFSDSSRYSWGLKSYAIWNPDSLDKRLISREVKNSCKNVVIDYRYYPESHTKYRHRYKSSNKTNILRKDVWNLGHPLFPFELNEQLDIFSFVRYDGYYFFNQHLRPTDQNGRSFFIKFLPNQSAQIIRKNEILTNLTDWSDTTSLTYKVDYLNDINETSNTFQIVEGGKIILKGRIEPNGLFLEMPNYENGPFLRCFLKYVK